MPGLGSVAHLPNELTDAVIDHLDFGSLLNAALVARSWRTRARVRLFARLEVWSGRCRTCERSRLPRGLAARMPCSVFVMLLDRDEDVFKYIRELHVVFSGGRMDQGARVEGDALLNALLRLPFGEIEHLAFYSFPDNSSSAFTALLRRCTTVRSLHLVDLQDVYATALIDSLKYTPKIRTIALLGGACLGEETVRFSTFADQMQARPASHTLPNSSQVFLAPDKFVDLLVWILHAPRLQRCLNVVGVRSFSWVSTLDDFMRAHNSPQMEAVMSSIQSLELIIDYEDKIQRLVLKLHAFQHVPTIQLTFESHAANLAFIPDLLQRPELAWSSLQCLVLSPRSSRSAAVPAEWSLVDEALANARFESLRSVVIFLRGEFAVGVASEMIEYLPQLRARGIVRVVRWSADATHNLFLPFVAQGEEL